MVYAVSSLLRRSEVVRLDKWSGCPRIGASLRFCASPPSAVGRAWTRRRRRRRSSNRRLRLLMRIIAIRARSSKQQRSFRVSWISFRSLICTSRFSRSRPVTIACRANNRRFFFPFVCGSVDGGGRGIRFRRICD